MQKSRFEDQRCDLKSTASVPGATNPHTPHAQRMYFKSCGKSTVVQICREGNDDVGRKRK